MHATHSILDARFHMKEKDLLGSYSNAPADVMSESLANFSSSLIMIIVYQNA